MNNGYTIPLEEACRRLGTTRPNVLMLLKTGRLAGEMRGEAWYLSEESVARHTASDRRTAPCAKTTCSCSGGCALENEP